MTFDEIVSRVCDRLNLTSSDATTRVGKSVNERYQAVITDVGLSTSVNVLANGNLVAGSRFVTFNNVMKVFSVSDFSAQAITSITRVSTTATVTTAAAHGYTTGQGVTIVGATQTEYNISATITVTGTTTFTYTVSGSPTTPATGTIFVQLQNPRRTFGKISLDEMRNRLVRSGTLGEDYADYSIGAQSVTIMLDYVPTTSTSYLTADAEMTISDLSGTNEPAFPHSFHDILIAGAKATEYEKMEKESLMKIEEARYEFRLAALRYHLATSGYQDIRQGKNQATRRWMR